METYQLVCHPDTPCAMLSGIRVEVGRSDRCKLLLRFVLSGTIDAISIPAPEAPERRDGLWQHTCLEVFVMPAGGEGYFEFNLSPASHWAAYRFDAYREGMAEHDIAPPRISTMAKGEGLTLEAEVDLSAAEADAGCRMALSAVIEARDGTRSYWALAHSPGAPDFHHPACFAAELPPPDKS